MGYRSTTPFMVCVAFIAAIAFVKAQKATEVSADFQQQLTQEESTRPAIYEIELVDWKNPSSKTFTGRLCNETSTTPQGCDPLFKYNVEVLRNRTVVTGGAHIIVNQTCLTWPGKTPMSEWLEIGKDNYNDVMDIEKIGIIRLAPVPEGELQDVILRVQVLDRNHGTEPKSAIGYFMCILPGTSNGRYMKAKPFELRSESFWSGPLHCFPAAHIDRFLAPYIYYPSQSEQELVVRYRVYHENDNKDTAAEHQQEEVDKMGEGDKKTPRNSRGYRMKRSPGILGGYGYGGLGLGGLGGIGLGYGGLGFGGYGLGLGGLGYGGLGYGGLGYGGLGLGGIGYGLPLYGRRFF